MGRGGRLCRGNPEGVPLALGALKILKVKKRARALRFTKPAQLLALRAVRVGDSTNGLWVIAQLYSQENVGDSTTLSTAKASISEHSPLVPVCSGRG